MISIVCGKDEDYFAYVGGASDGMATEYFASSDKSQEDAVVKLATALAQRLYDINALIHKPILEGLS